MREFNIKVKSKIFRWVSVAIVMLVAGSFIMAQNGLSANAATRLDDLQDALYKEEVVDGGGYTYEAGYIYGSSQIKGFGIYSTPTTLKNATLTSSGALLNMGVVIGGSNLNVTLENVNTDVRNSSVFMQSSGNNITIVGGEFRGAGSSANGAIIGIQGGTNNMITVTGAKFYLTTSNGATSGNGHIAYLGGSNNTVNFIDCEFYVNGNRIPEKDLPTGRFAKEGSSNSFTFSSTPPIVDKGIEFIKVNYAVNVEGNTWEGGYGTIYSPLKTLNIKLSDMVVGDDGVPNFTYTVPASYAGQELNFTFPVLYFTNQYPAIFGTDGIHFYAYNELGREKVPHYYDGHPEWEPWYSQPGNIAGDGHAYYSDPESLADGYYHSTMFNYTDPSSGATRVTEGLVLDTSDGAKIEMAFFPSSNGYEEAFRVTIVREADTVGPVVKVTSPKYGDVVKNSCDGCVSQTITGTVSDEGSGVDRVEVYLRKVNDAGKLGGRGDKLDATVNADGTWSLDIDTSTLADGKWGFDVVAYDKAGNKNNQFNWGGNGGNGFIVDNTAPVIKVTSPNKYYIEKGDSYIEMGYSATDARDGDLTGKVVVTYRYNNNGNWEVKPSVDTTLVGEWTVWYSVTDSACNASNRVTRAFVVRDTTAPTGTISYNPTDWTRGTVTATLTTDEPIMTPDGWTKVDDTHFTKKYSTNTTETVKICDLTGVNCSNVEVKVDNIDNVKPYINPSATADLSSDQNTLTVGDANIADNESGLASTSCAIYNADKTDYALRPNFKCAESANISSLGNGTYYLKIWAKDKVGNTNEVWVDFNIDRSTDPGGGGDGTDNGGSTGETGGGNNPGGGDNSNGGNTSDNQTGGGNANVNVSTPNIVATSPIYTGVASVFATATTPTNDADGTDDGTTDTVATNTANVTQSTTAYNSNADESDGEVLGAKDEESWALVNLLLAIGTALVSVVLLVGYFKREENDEKLHRRGVMRIVSLVPAVGAVVAFLLTENMSLPMKWFDVWTILMVVIAIVQIVIMTMSRASHDERA